MPGTGQVLRKHLLNGWESTYICLCQQNRIPYLKIKRLNGLPILVVRELAKERPLLLQVFIETLKREQRMEGRACS